MVHDPRDVGEPTRSSSIGGESFPDEWELDRVLMENITAIDTTPLRTDDGYWFFTAIDGPGGGGIDELHIFRSDSLTGSWERHPLNPVVSDVRCARGGGRIFEHDGRLIRPAQDCSKTYGGALVFREIVTLDERRYEERAFAVLGPTWAPGLRTTHHYSRTGSFEVIDGARVA